MSSEKLKQGDQVQLKSGGPVMTVVNPGGFTGWPICNWFEGDKLKTGGFPPGALRRVPGEEARPGRPLFGPDGAE
jgi:uncharacterized protein YodC (DUF2158 family)